MNFTLLLSNHTAGFASVINIFFFSGIFLEFLTVFPLNRILSFNNGLPFSFIYNYLKQNHELQKKKREKKNLKLELELSMNLIFLFLRYCLFTSNFKYFTIVDTWQIFETYSIDSCVTIINSINL